MRRRDFLFLGAGLPIGLFAIREALDSFGGPQPVVGSLLDNPSGARTLPSWFLQNRVHVHTRLGTRRWEKRPEFEQYSRIVRELGGKVLLRHVKSRDEPPSWPSKVEHNGSGPDLAKQMIDRAHADGMRIIAYYWHMAEVEVAKRHTDWLCHDLSGRVSNDERGDYLDLSGPFRDVVLRRLLELAERGVDGLFFDHRHMPRNGCFDSALERTYQRATGKSVQRKSRLSDRGYIDFLAYQAEQIAATFEYWQNGVHAKYPGVVFVVSTYVLPGLVSVRIPMRLATVVDSPKSEFRLVTRPGVNEDVFKAGTGLATPRDDVRMALGWALLRDAADGRPPHIWSTGFPNTDHARGATGAVLTWGGIANMDLHEQYILGTDLVAKEQRAAVKGAIELGNAAGPTLGQSRPLRWAAIHFAENARDAVATDPVRAMREVGWPVTGVFGTLVDAGLPVGIVTDDQLAAGQLAEYEVLFLPAPRQLSTAQRQAVDAFRARGGLVIEQTTSLTWHSAAGLTIAARALLRQLDAKTATAPVRAENLALGAHAVPYRSTIDSRVFVALTNKFDWVQEEAPTRSAGRVAAAPAPAGGIRIRLAQAASSATELVSGARITPQENGQVIALPPLRTFALLEIRPR